MSETFGRVKACVECRQQKVSLPSEMPAFKPSSDSNRFGVMHTPITPNRVRDARYLDFAASYRITSKGEKGKGTPHSRDSSRAIYNLPIANVTYSEKLSNSNRLRICELQRPLLDHSIKLQPKSHTTALLLTMGSPLISLSYSKPIPEAIH
jgi:hypothetical protein